MTDHRELLQRAAERGVPRGPSDLIDSLELPPYTIESRPSSQLTRTRAVAMALALAVLMPLSLMALQQRSADIGNSEGAEGCVVFLQHSAKQHTLDDLARAFSEAGAERTWVFDRRRSQDEAIAMWGAADEVIDALALADLRPSVRFHGLAGYEGILDSWDNAALVFDVTCNVQLDQSGQRSLTP